jgi:predicted transposase/invertase (TIGR01784 family)
MDRRSLFYWSKEYSESLEAGQDYRELPDVIAVNIVDFDYPPVRNFHTRFHLREDHDQDLVLTDALEIHFLNMVQYRKRGRQGIAEDSLCRWLTWFDASSPPELVAEVVKMDSAILAANERMVYVTGDKEAIRAYEMRQMGLSDYNSSMNYARETGYAEGHADGHAVGHAEGHAEGQTEGRNEERQHLLEMLDQGLSVEEIKRRLTERI